MFFSISSLLYINAFNSALFPDLIKLIKLSCFQGKIHLHHYYYKDYVDN